MHLPGRAGPRGSAEGGLRRASALECMLCLEHLQGMAVWLVSRQAMSRGPGRRDARGAGGRAAVPGGRDHCRLRRAAGTGHQAPRGSLAFRGCAGDGRGSGATILWRPNTGDFGISPMPLGSAGRVEGCPPDVGANGGGVTIAGAHGPGPFGLPLSELAWARGRWERPSLGARCKEGHVNHAPPRHEGRTHQQQGAFGRPGGACIAEHRGGSPGTLPRKAARQASPWAC